MRRLNKAERTYVVAGCRGDSFRVAPCVPVVRACSKHQFKQWPTAFIVASGQYSCVDHRLLDVAIAHIVRCVVGCCHHSLLQCVTFHTPRAAHYFRKKLFTPFTLRQGFCELVVRVLLIAFTFTWNGYIQFCEYPSGFMLIYGYVS